MIYAAPGTSFTCDVEAFPTGLTGHVAVQILDDDGTPVLARTTAGITESPAGSGHYLVTLVAPAIADQYSVFWDDGTSSPFTTAAEDLIVTPAGVTGGDPRDLCVVADVKTAMEPQSSTSSRDALIQTLITSASVTLMRRLEREFTPQSNATRTAKVRVQERQVDGTLVVDLAPWDLRSVTSMELHPEDAAPITLTANSDYALEPIGAPRGSYQRVRLSRLLVVVSNFEIRFGYAQLQINGGWGLWNTASVDADVRDACVLTVRSWLRQNPGADQIGLMNRQIEQGLQPAIPATWFIPNAALQRLAGWRRMAA